MKKLIIALIFCAFSRLLSLPSTSHPQLIEKETVIQLTEDITIAGHGSPFIASNAFGSALKEKLIITSHTKNKIIIKSNGTWDLSTFNTKNKIIEFKGNAQLVSESGAHIIFNNGLLRFTDSSKWVIG